MITLYTKLYKSTIMLTKSTEETVVANAIPVLKIFKNSLHRPLRLVDIEKRIKLSHQTVFRKTKILESNGILTKVGNYYKLNYENSFVYKILELVAAGKREEFFTIYPRFKKPFNQLIDFALKNQEITYIILFGSYARSKATKTSDIDLFIVIEETGIEKIKEKLENLFIQLEGSYFLKKYGFAPIYATPKDVKEMIDERKKFIQSIIEESVIIYGENNYYRNMVLLLKDWVIWK